MTPIENIMPQNLLIKVALKKCVCNKVYTNYNTRTKGTARQGHVPF